MAHRRGVLVACAALVAVALAPATASSGAPAAPAHEQGARAKLDTSLVAALTGPAALGAAAELPVTVSFRAGRYAQGLAAARAAGLHIMASTDRAPLPVASGRASADEVGVIAALTDVQAVSLTSRGLIDSEWPGAAVSEGDAFHHGPQARRAIDRRNPSSVGRGLTIGVISDSVDQRNGGIADSQATGDLPPSDRIRVNADDPGQSDEGRAMMEIIYDSVPGASYAFSSGTDAGAVGKARSIEWLARPVRDGGAGASVIADDVFYLSEPFFQDGVVSQAVDAARAQHDVLYFASAGNRARQSWEGTFTPAARGRQPFHDFDPGPGVDTVQTITATKPGGSVYLVLQWAEPWGRATTDIDAELINATTGEPLVGPMAAGRNDTGTTAIPSEELYWANSGTEPVVVGLRVQRHSSRGTPFMKYIVHGALYDPVTLARMYGISEYATNSDTINPDAASARSAVAVAAVDQAFFAANPRYRLITPQPYSSRGNKVRLFDQRGRALPAPEVRAKPDLAGADGVWTTFFSRLDGTKYRFFGTSAATPSVAAVAALVRASDRRLTAAQTLAALKSTQRSVSDCVAPGFPDTDCGSGFVFADRAISQARR